MTDNVRQAVFQAGIKDAAIRDHLALHAGRLDSFDKMAAEVSTVARTRSENDVVPMDVSVLKGKDGKGKDGRAKKEKAKRVRRRRRPRMTGTSLIPSRVPTSSRSVSTVPMLELIAERRNVTMRNAETCRHRTV